MMVLSYDAYTQVIEENENEKQSEITKLRNGLDEMQSTLKDVIDLIKLKVENDTMTEDGKKDREERNQINSIAKCLSEKGIKNHRYLVP